jgi:hypothetical protein
MATAAESNNSQISQPALRSTATGIFIGLAWGGAMLFVFGFWMRSKYADTRQALTYIFLAAGAVAAALAAWQAFTLWIQKETPEQKSATLEKQRRLFSYLFLGAGLGLIVLAFFLGIDKKPPGNNYGFKLENFAETFGALLLGLIALCGGYVLQQPLTSSVSPIQFLVGKIPVLKMSLIVLGVASLFTFGFIFYKQGREFAVYFPELAALMFMSMLCLACLLWLNTGQFDEFGIRLFVLIFGGAVGVILFFETMCRAYLWRQDILLGGSTAWQGENAYRFWLCAYLLFVSLVLMFLSFSLARADIRKNVVLRRVMYGYDTVVQGMLLVGILGILNIVVYALVPFTFDWTMSRGAYALAESNKNLIAGLKQKTNIVVLLPEGHPIYKDVRNLMENCLAISRDEMLKVKYISPDINQRDYADLVKVFPSIYPDVPLAGRETGRGVLIVYGDIPREEKNAPPYSFIPDRKLFEEQRPMKGGEKMKFTFKGEKEIFKELQFLIDAKKKRKIYVLQGNDAPDINVDGGIAQRMELRRGFAGIGLGLLVDRLNSENYEVFGLSFSVESKLQKNPPAKVVFATESGADKKKNVPEDCDTLIVAGVSTPLDDKTLDAIERYMERGGKMLVFLDVIADDSFSTLVATGMESLLRRYGVEVTNEFPLRVPVANVDPETLLATTPKNSENPLASRFVGKSIVMRNTARVVRPVDAPGRFKGETVLHLERAPRWFYIVEKDVAILRDPIEHMVGLLRDPEIKLAPKLAKDAVPVAVAVEEVDGAVKKPRLVVFGDTEFITNLEIARSQTKQTNYAFTVSAIEWMAEHTSIGGLPSEHAQFTLDPSVDYWRMILLPSWMMLVALSGLGVSIWIVRRR